jgi:sugar phosphate isomerase/epimerase
MVAGTHRRCSQRCSTVVKAVSTVSAEKSHDLYGMDVGFYSSLGNYGLEARCAMLAELGYASTNLTLWSETAWRDLEDLSATAREHGLDVASINVTVDISASLHDSATTRVLDLIRAAEGLGTIELALVGEDLLPSDDKAALSFMDAAIAAAEGSNSSLSLYPHAGYWLSRPSDAVRICEKLECPSLGVTFSSFHWYAYSPTESLTDSLRAARRHLRLVNTCGSRQVSGQYFPASIEPVGDGEFDTFAFFGMLHDVGYRGPIGILAYGLGGDAYAYFRRSRDAIRDVEQRLIAHPDWAKLRPDTL